MSKIKWALIIILCIALLCSGCGVNRDYRNKKSDDNLSAAVYEAVGEDVFYLFREDIGDLHEYEFFLNKDDVEIVKHFLEVIDSELTNSEDKIVVSLSCKIPGGREVGVRVSNYTDKSSTGPDLAAAKRVEAFYPEVSFCEAFKNPEVYTVIKDVKYLSISDKLYDAAKDKSIVWNELWPSLEDVEIMTSR